MANIPLLWLYLIDLRIIYYWRTNRFNNLVNTINVLYNRLRPIIYIAALNYLIQLFNWPANCRPIK
jgi:hypothetical protein